MLIVEFYSHAKHMHMQILRLNILDHVLILSHVKKWNQYVI